MSKKIISIILCGTLVFCSFSTCFAVSTDSAIKATKELKSSEVRATPPDGSSSNPYYTKPQSSSGNRYYVNDSTGTVSSDTAYVTTWGDLMNHLTYSIAYSIKGITSRLSTLVTNLSTYLNSTASSSYYYWDWSPTNGVQQGAPESAETIVQAVRNIGSQLSKSVAYGTEYTYQLYDHFINGSGLTVKLDSPWQPYFMPAEGYNYNQSNWKYSFRVNLNNDGTVSRVDYNETNYLVHMHRIILDCVQNTGIIGTYLVQNVKNQSSELKLYDKDLNSTNTGTGANVKSFWYDFRALGSNLSYHLSRLGYVLASDEEIEARQAAAANQDAVVDDFIKPTGSGSASASDFADVASIGGTMKDALNSNVSAGSAFTSLSSSSDAWDWFSTDTANSLDTSSNQRSQVSSTPLLDNYYSEVLENLRFK